MTENENNKTSNQKLVKKLIPVIREMVKFTEQDIIRLKYPRRNLRSVEGRWLRTLRVRATLVYNARNVIRYVLNDDASDFGTWNRHVNKLRHVGQFTGDGCGEIHDVDPYECHKMASFTINILRDIGLVPDVMKIDSAYEALRIQSRFLIDAEKASRRDALDSAAQEGPSGAH